MKRTPGDIAWLIEGNKKAEVLEKPGDLTHLLVMASYGRHGIRNKAIIWMLYGSGLRVSEVPQIRIKDMLTKNGTLKMMFTIPGGITKTNKARTIYVYAKEQRKALNAWLEYRKENGGMLGDPNDWGGFKPESPVFIINSGGAWRKFALNVKKYTTAEGEERETYICSSLENLVRELHKKAGFRGSSSHSGRRTLATWMNRKGIAPDVIRSVLRHESTDMTAEYIDSDRKRIKAALTMFWGDVKVK